MIPTFNLELNEDVLCAGELELKNNSLSSDDKEVDFSCDTPIYCLAMTLCIVHSTFLYLIYFHSINSQNEQVSSCPGSCLLTLIEFKN